METRTLDEQEEFWKNEFGDEYSERNNYDIYENKKNLFEKIIKNLDINSILEIGCNRGLNLEAINSINSNIELYGDEINAKAVEMLKEKNICKNIFNNSIFDLNEDTKIDLVFTFGVLIHINPEKLKDVYTKMYNLSNKYILIGEYYSRNIQEIKYRGNDNKLFKRDFSGELLNLYPNLKIVDYGFVYHRDPKYPLDDITWFLFEKN